MIASAFPGGAFVKAAAYVLEKEGAEYVGGTIGDADRKELGLVARQARLLAPNLNKQQAYHVALNLPPGEQLSTGDWRDVAHEYVKAMGLENTPWVAARHHDTDHDHLHIVSYRVDFQTGKAVSIHGNYRKSALAVQAIERAYGLQATARTPDEARSQRQRGLTHRERQSMDRVQDMAAEGKPLSTQELNYKAPSKRVIRQVLDQALGQGRSAVAFQRELQWYGLQVQLHTSPDQAEVYGMSFQLGDGRAVKASSLGRDYQLEGLRARGLTFDTKQDQDVRQAWVVDRKDLSGLRTAKRTRAEARALIEAAMKKAHPVGQVRGLAAWVEAMEAQGVAVRPNIAKSTDRLHGFTFRARGDAGWELKGSQVGEGRLAELQALGISYDPERDAERLRQFKLAYQQPDPSLRTGALPGRHRGTDPSTPGGAAGRDSPASPLAIADDGGPVRQAGAAGAPGPRVRAPAGHGRPMGGSGGAHDAELYAELGLEASDPRPASGAGRIDHQRSVDLGLDGGQHPGLLEDEAERHGGGHPAAAVVEGIGGLGEDPGVFPSEGVVGLHPRGACACGTPHEGIDPAALEGLLEELVHPRLEHHVLTRTT